MQVLLLKDVADLGHAGDIKNVAGGYAQNYLFPRKLAVPASEGAQKQSKSLQEAAQRRREHQATEARQTAARLDGQEVVFLMRAGEGDRLYGSITNQDVAEKLQASTGIEVDRRFVELEHPIKALGEHSVAIRLGAGAVAHVRVRVERQGEES
jgi:large subunit ribosomal protein L9